MKKIKWWRVFAIVTFPLWALPALAAAVLFCILYVPFLTCNDLYYWVIDEEQPINDL